MLCAAPVDKESVKEVSYPPTHNQHKDLISLEIYSLLFAIIIKHFCTTLISKPFLISKSLYLLLCVCPCGWVPRMFILLQSAVISGQDVQR